LDAQACGLNTVAVTYGLQSKDDLLEVCPDRLVESPEEIPRAVESLLD
jgi:phosphoglycolate phosphatase-like HAD superfamily hydrolase